MKALRTAVTAAVAILTPVAAFAALTLLPSAPASAAPADNGVSLAPLCSVLSVDTFAGLRDSHVLPAAAVKATAGLPDPLVVDILRAKLGCDSSAIVVTGAKANAVLCDQILNRDYIVGVIDSPKLPLNPTQRAKAAGDVSDANVAQARDLFNCDAPTSPVSPPPSSSSSSPPPTSPSATSQPPVQNPGTVGAPVPHVGTPSGSTSSSSSATSGSHTSNTQKPSTDGDSLTKLPNTSAGIDTGGL